jgi:hypothetical protein
MIIDPAPITEPVEQGGKTRVTTAAWVLFFQNLYKAVGSISSWANSSVASVTTNTTLDSSHYFVKATGVLTITLPDATLFTGKQYIIKKLGAGILTVNTTSAQTIDGSTFLTIDIPYVALSVESDGANWSIT